MSGANRRIRVSWIERLIEDAERIERDVCRLRDQLEVLVRTQRSLITARANPVAESTLVKLDELVDAGQEAREDLLRAHNSLVGIRREVRSLDAAPSLDHECGGAPEPRDLLRSEDYMHHALTQAWELRSRAALRLQRMISVLHDGAATGQQVVDMQSHRIFDLLVDRIDGDLLVKLYRLFLASSRDLERLEGLCDFLVTLSDLPEAPRRRLVIGGLHEFSRATLASNLRRLFRRGQLSDEIYRAIAEDD